MVRRARAFAPAGATEGDGAMASRGTAFVRRRAVAGLVAAAGLGGWPGAFPPADAAAAIAVTTTTDELADDGDCSLREALRAAGEDRAVDACPAGHGPDTVVVPAGTYALSRAAEEPEDAGLTGDLDVHGALSIVGAGQSATIIDAHQIDRVLHVHPDADVTVADLTMQGGIVPAGDPDATGSGVLNEGTLSLERTTLTRNADPFATWGGALGNRGTALVARSSIIDNEADVSTAGIFNDGDLQITDSEVSENFSGLAVAGIESSGEMRITRSRVRRNHGYSVGAIAAGGAVTLHETVVAENYATGTGGLRVGGTTLIEDSDVVGNVGVFGPGGVNNFGALDIRRTTVRDNVNLVQYSAGGLVNTVSGATIAVSASAIVGNRGHTAGGLENLGTAEFVNSTISGNRVHLGETPDRVGNAPGGGAVTNAGTLRLLATTVTGNEAEQDPFIPPAGPASGGVAVVAGQAWASGTILAGNVGISGPSPDCAGPLESGGYNLIGDPSGCTVTGVTEGNLVGVDALLGPLGDHGGPTPTHLPRPGSPAIDGGTRHGGAAACPRTDQRGIRRPQDGDGDRVKRCDVGAVEVARRRT